MNSIFNETIFDNKAFKTLYFSTDNLIKNILNDCRLIYDYFIYLSKNINYVLLNLILSTYVICVENIIIFDCMHRS